MLAWFANADPAINQVKGKDKLTQVDVQPGNIFLGVDINQTEVPDHRNPFARHRLDDERAG